MQKPYHVALLKGETPSVVILQLRETIDELSCEVWRYFGCYFTTKSKLNPMKPQLLAAINQQFQSNFDTLRVS